MGITTTVIGSYPYARMAPEEAILRAVDEQVAAGVDVISDGQVRADMVGIFAKGIPGYDVQGRKYNVTGKITPPVMPITLSDLTLARERAAGRARVKGIITGPTTMAHCSILAATAPYKPHHMPEGGQMMAVDPELVMDIARAMAAEARFLAEAGFDVIQFDEPFFSLPGVDMDLGLSALAVAAAPAPFSALHVCGDVASIMPKLLGGPVNLLEVEGARLEKLDWLTPALLAEKKKRICWGVVAVDTNEVEEEEVIAARIRAGAAKIGAENLWISPDCGMRARKPDAARQKLEHMVKAARRVAGELGR